MGPGIRLQYFMVAPRDPRSARLRLAQGELSTPFCYAEDDDAPVARFFPPT